MTKVRIELYLADSYLHGFSIEDPEYNEIINYLKSLISSEKSKESRNKILLEFLGNSKVLTTGLLTMVLKKNHYGRI